MPEYLSPGVYIEEIERGPKPIEGVATSTAAFLGEAQRGPLMPTLVTSYGQYLRLFGDITAQRLFTHRHTVRYRLERVRDLTGLDVASTDGRERLGLGLKAMRVLGIASPQGPATEAGAGGGRVRREQKDR